MPSISKSFIRKLIDNVQIEDVIGRRVKLIKKGHEFQALCPFHNEKTPSFTISPQKQFYYCFGCHASGNSIDFLKDYEKLDFVEAVEALSSIAGIPIEYDENDAKPVSIDRNVYKNIHKKLAEAFNIKLLQNKDALTYTHGRNISNDMIKQFLVGYAPGSDNGQFLFMKKSFQVSDLSKTGLFIQKASGFKDRFQQRLMFPIRNKQGDYIAFGGRALKDQNPKYLNSPETDWFLKNKILYGLFETLQINKNPKQIIVVEGYTDVIQLFQHGYPYAVAALGTAFSSSHYIELCRSTPHIVFCFDGDRAGSLAAMKACKVCLSRYQDGVEVSFIILPDGQDPDTLLNSNDSNAINEQIEKAYTMESFIFEYIQTLHNTSTTSGKASYINEINELVNSMPNNATKHIFLSKLEKEELLLNKNAPKKYVKTQSVAPSTSYKDLSLLSIIISNPKKFIDVIDEFKGQYTCLKNTRILKVAEFITKYNIESTSSYLEQSREHEFSLENLGLSQSSLFQSNHTSDSFKLLLIKYLIQRLSILVNTSLHSGHSSGIDQKTLNSIFKEKSSLKILEESLEYRLTNLE